jgi:hypothetical protein
MALAKDGKEASVEKMKKRMAKVQSTKAVGHAYMYKQV